MKISFFENQIIFKDVDISLYYTRSTIFFIRTYILFMSTNKILEDLLVIMDNFDSVFIFCEIVIFGLIILGFFLFIILNWMFYFESTILIIPLMLI